MKNFIISSDSTCDLPNEYCEKNHIPILHVYYRFENELFGEKNSLPLSIFYKSMRDGGMPSTAAPNIAETKAFFTKLIKTCPQIIHISFSSGLSSTYQNAILAANEIMDEHKHCKICVIDSISASLGEGFLIHTLLTYKKEGHSYEETIIYANMIKNKINHIFTVDSLSYLHKGGRISKASALVGELINIKPILILNDEGKLVMCEKVRGRKKALLYLFEKYKKEATRPENTTLMISHCDCIEDANFLKEHILRVNPSVSIIINQICPSIGAHSGPGTVAIFFVSDKR